VPFAFDGEKKFFTIDVKFNSTNPGVDDVVGPNEAVAIKVSDTGWKKLVALAFVGVYIGGAMLSTSNNHKEWGELLKGIGLVGIFLALGSKKIV
jgi:hypothetical protein